MIFYVSRIVDKRARARLRWNISFLCEPLFLKWTKQPFIFWNIKKIIVTQKKSCIIINEKREILPLVWLFKEEEINGNYFKI